MSTKKRRQKKSQLKYLLNEYNFEIFILFLIFLGIFLLLENFELKSLIKTLINDIFNLITLLFKKFYHFIFNFISRIEQSDIVGLSLLSIAFFLIIIRWRYRLILKYSFFDTCRNCNNKIQRIKRKRIIKISSYLLRLKVKKYECKICKLQDYKISRI